MPVQLQPLAFNSVNNEDEAMTCDRFFVTAVSTVYSYYITVAVTVTGTYKWPMTYDWPYDSDYDDYHHARS